MELTFIKYEISTKIILDIIKQEVPEIVKDYDLSKEEFIIIGNKVFELDKDTEENSQYIWMPDPEGYKDHVELQDPNLLNIGDILDI